MKYGQSIEVLVDAAQIFPKRPKAAKAELPESVPGEAVANDAKALRMPNYTRKA